FNPRGEDFSTIPSVRRFGGLLLLCLDPNGVAQDLVGKALGYYVRNEFQSWTTETTNWLKPGRAPDQLIRFVEHWGKRNPGRTYYRWPKSTPCIDLLYALVHWVPKFHNDPEGQIYLEVFTRQLEAAEQVSNFKARVVSDARNKELSLRSVGHLLQ